MRKTLMGLAVIGGLVLAMVAPARADQTNFTIDTGNTALSPYTGPYATVNVNLTDSTHATITFTASAPVSGYTFSLMGVNIADVNVNATPGGWTIGTFTQTPASWSSGGTLSDTGSGNLGGSFGVFNQTTQLSGGFGNALTEVSFVLTNTGGTWANAASVLTPNGDNNEVAAHIAVCGSTLGPCTSGNTAVVTGFATGVPAPVPEPASLLLLGTGLLGLGAIRRRGKKRNA